MAEPSVKAGDLNGGQHFQFPSEMFLKVPLEPLVLKRTWELPARMVGIQDGLVGWNAPPDDTDIYVTAVDEKTKDRYLILSHCPVTLV